MFAKCRYAQCHYAKCRSTECLGTFTKKNVTLVQKTGKLIQGLNKEAMLPPIKVGCFVNFLLQQSLKNSTSG
jgi:hypothetical protein